MSDGTAAPAGRTLAVRLSDWRRARVWLRSSFLPEQNYLVILAVVVGVVTGLGSVGFILFIELLADFARGPVAALLERFGPARLVLLPALGGLMVGPLVQRFGPEAKGHGVPEVMTALATRGGHVRKRIVAVKVVAAALTIGFGGAAGRVGPLVQIGSAVGSTVARWTRPTRPNVRRLATCGAAGGVAAILNAPIAAAIFAMEVLIGRVRGDFLLVLLTSLGACLTARYFLGNFPAFRVPEHELASAAELPLYFLMGTLLGTAAIGYVRLLYWSEDAFGGWRFPDYLKPAAGGLVVGLLLRFYPQIYGAGFPAIEPALEGRLPWELLLGLFAAQLLANCATLGSGGSGGVFAPCLYMGAMLGGACGSLANGLLPGWTAGSGAYAMVGMAAFFAAAAKAPTTSILLLLEMTDDYRIVLPLMAATAGSVYVSHRVLPFSVYTLKLQRRDAELHRDEGVEPPPAPTAERAGPPIVA